MKQKKQFVAPAVTIMNMQVETSIMAGSEAYEGQGGQANSYLTFKSLGNWE